MLLAAGGVLVSACLGLAQHRGAAHLCLRLPNTDHAHRSRQWRHRDIVHPTLEVHHHLRVVAAAADQQAPHGAGVTTQVGGAQPVCITPVLQLRQHLPRAAEACAQRAGGTAAGRRPRNELPLSTAQRPLRVGQSVLMRLSIVPCFILIPGSSNYQQLLCKTLQLGR